MSIRSLVTLFFITLLTSFTAVAEEQPTTTVLNLSAEMKPLITKEMQAVEKGMQELVSSLARGDWGKTTAVAKQIQTSYILRQSLTAEQIHQFLHTLPEEFVRLDREFHGFAGMLSHAAKAKNKDISNFYFYKMIESCNQCHSRFAKERFPSFVNKKEAHSDHKH